MRADNKQRVLKTASSESSNSRSIEAFQQNNNQMVVEHGLTGPESLYSHNSHYQSQMMMPNVVSQTQTHSNGHSKLFDSSV